MRAARGHGERGTGGRRSRTVLLAALVVVLAACGNLGSDAAEGDGGGSGGTGGGGGGAGTLQVALATVDYQDPEPGHYVSGNQYNHLLLAFEPLFVNDPETGELQGHLAEDWTVSEDGLTIDITLREGVTFHDGSPLTAEDAAYSIRRYVGLEGGEDLAPLGRERLAAAVEAVEATSDLELTVTATPTGAATLLADLAGNPGSAVGFVVPKAVVEELGDDGFNDAPIGTGPFRFDSSEPGRSMAYDAYEDYWGEGPNIDRLEISLVPELATRVSMLRAGSVDIIDAVSGPAMAEIEGDSDLRLVSSERAFLSNMSVGGQTNPDSPLSDVDVRRALAMAIDRQGIIDSLLGGQGEPAYLFSFPGSIGFPEDADELVWEHDPDAAAELLEGAGYGDGFSLELVVPTVGRELAGAVAQGWRELGVDVTVSVVEQAEALSDMQSDERKQDTRIIMVWGPNGIPFRSEISGSMSTHLNGGAAHSQPLATPTVPELVVAQGAEVDPDARAGILSDLLTTTFEEVDVIPSWYVNSLYGVGPRVGTWEVPAGATYLTGMDSLELAG